MKKITQFCVLMIIVFFGYGAKAQVAAYDFTHQIGTFTPNSTTAISVAIISDDVASPLLPIGFNFVFGSTTYTQFYMSSNGFLSFGPTSATLTGNDLSAANAAQRPFIAPLWDDLAGATVSNSNASYELTGTAPNRVLTVEWLNWEWNYGATSPVISFQAKLYETTNTIEFIYRQESVAINGTGSASIGISDPTGSGSGTFLNLEADLTNPTVNSITSVTNISTKPATDQLFRFTRPACLYGGTISVGNFSIPTASINLSIPATLPMNFYVTNGAAPNATDPPTGTVAVGSSTLPLTGLTSGTTYTVYLKYACGSLGNNWFYLLTFTTPCDIVTGSFYEDFNSAPIGTTTNPTVPNCWTYLKTGTSTSIYGYTYATAGQTGLGFRGYRTSTTTVGDLILISPETVDLGAGTKQIRFSARRQYTGNYAGKVHIYTMNGNTATSTKTLIASINIPLITWQEYIIPLPNTTDDYFAFSFEQESATKDIFIDDVYYENLSPCAAPGKIGAINITATGATINWDKSMATGVTGYDWEVRDMSGAVVKSGTISSANTVSAPVTGLIPGTYYEVFVRSKCGSTPGSWTTNPHQFATLCALLTGNFFEGFENTPMGSSSTVGTSNYASQPLCWSYIDNTTGWGYTTTTVVLAPSLQGFYTYRPNVAGDLLLVSPETANLGAGNKRVRFSAKVSSTSYITTQKLEVLTMNGNTATATKTAVAASFALTDSWQEFIVYLPNTTDDYFAFSFDRNAGAVYYYIDNTHSALLNEINF